MILQKILLKRKIKLPTYIQSKVDKLKIINIWGGKKMTVSKWHYDAYDNFNYILKVFNYLFFL